MTIYRDDELQNPFIGKKIKFVSAGCATGKTRAVCLHIQENLAKRNFMYCGRSLELIKETATTLRRLGVTPKIITSDNPAHEWRVKKDIATFLEEAPKKGVALLITGNARIDLTHSVDPCWEVFFDEVPQVDTYYPWMLPRHHEFITDHLELDADDTSEEGRMMVKVRRKFDSDLAEIVRGVPDDIDARMRPFYLNTLSPGKEVFVHFDSFRRVFSRKEIATEHGGEEKNIVPFLSMLRPEPFLNATIVGANIEDSLLYHWFRDWHGVEFEENKEITRHLRTMPDEIGERLKVSYFIPGNRFASKHLLGQTDENSVSNQDKMNQLALQEFKQAPFLYAPNNRTTFSIEDEPNCTRVPVVCHGLNRFSSFHNVFCPIALNRDTFHLHLLEAGFGLSKEVIHRATAQEMIYQIVSRTNLRVFDSTDLVHAIVPDYLTAKRLADLYGSKKLTHLGGSLFEPKTPLNQTEKNRRYREKLKTAKAESLLLTSMEAPNEENDSIAMSLTVCGSPYAKSRKEFSEHRLNISDFLSFMREQSRRKIAKKEAGLFNLSVFNPPEGAEDYRTLEHFKSASGLVLDFDNGELSPTEFERIFWSEAGRGRKMSFIVTNTFSRDAKRQNKFRVIIPFRRPAQSVREFHAVYDEIVHRIEAHGYRKPARGVDGADLDAGGLDRSSRSPTQLFYWPCTNEAYPDAAFFRVWDFQKRELERYAVDPADVAKNAPVTPVAPPMPLPTAKTDQEKVDKAIRQWREVGCRPGNGNREFFILGSGLAYAGVPEYEIEQTLKEQSQYAHNPKDRRRNVPHIVRNIRRGRRG